MALETLYAASTVSGNASGPANAHGISDAVWTTDIDGISWTHRWQMQAPSAKTTFPSNGTLKIRWRKDSTNSGTPSASVTLIMNGASDPPTTISVTSSGAGQEDTIILPTGSRTDFQVDIAVTAAGGSPKVRSTIQVDSISLTVDVSAPGANVAPTANAGADQNRLLGDTVTLSGSGTDTDGTIASYQWTQVAGPFVDNLFGSTSATATFSPSSTGTYVFRLQVTDNGGLIGTDDVTINVTGGNIAPTANAGPDQNVTTGTQITLTGAASSDVDGTIFAYNWSQTLGTTVTLAGTGATRTFTPTVAETYRFSLTVTDNSGATSTADTVDIFVTASSKMATFTDDFSGTLSKWVSVSPGVSVANGIVTFNVSAAYDLMDSPRHDMAESSLLAQWVRLPALPTGVEFYLSSIADASNYLSAVLYGEAETLNLLCRVRLNGVNTNFSHIPIGQWVRIRESAGTAYFDTSADGVAWTQHRAIVHGLSAALLGSMFIEVMAGDYNANPASTADLDNVNLSGSVDTVNAGADQTVRTKASVTLTATGSVTPTWSQASGTVVTFSQSAGVCTFIAPNLINISTIVMRATAGGATDDVTVNVKRAFRVAKVGGVYVPVNIRPSGT